MRVFIADEASDSSGIYEDSGRLFDQMRDCFGSWPTGSKVDSPVQKFLINSREFVQQVDSDVMIGRAIRGKFRPAADRQGVRRPECFPDMWLGTARYQKSYRKMVFLDRRDEEVKNLLLDFMVLAFVQAVDYDYGHKLKAWGVLKRV
jgi:hypothetical protein